MVLRTDVIGIYEYLKSYLISIISQLLLLGSGQRQPISAMQRTRRNKRRS